MGAGCADGSGAVAGWGTADERGTTSGMGAVSDNGATGLGESVAGGASGGAGGAGSSESASIVATDQVSIGAASELVAEMSA